MNPEGVDAVDSSATEVALQWPWANTVVDASWADCVRAFARGAAGQQLQVALREARQRGVIMYPPQPLRALRLTPLHGVRVVIVGQDPYHQAGQANGLAFSVGPGQRRPPSLRNVLEEVVRDWGQTCITDGQLEPWAQQGVLLINRVLTVEDSRPNAHAGWGWELMSDMLLGAVNALPHPVAFLLWGAHAQKLRACLDESRHRVWVANHPSPLSARRGPQPFVGCAHFSAVNRWLQQQGQSAIQW